MASSSLVAASNVASQIVPPATSKLAASQATTKPATSKVEDAKVLTWSQSVFGKMNENASSALAYTATDSWCGKKSVKLFARTVVFSILTAGATVEAAARAIIGIALKIVGFPLSFCKLNFLNNWADATLNSAKVTGQNAKSALGSIFTMKAPLPTGPRNAITVEQLQHQRKILNRTAPVSEEVAAPVSEEVAAPVSNDATSSDETVVENTDSWYPGKYLGQLYNGLANMGG